MVRIVLGLLAALFALTILRTILASFQAMVKAMFSGATAAGPLGQNQPRQPVSQVLRRCSQCGTFTPESLAKRSGKAGAEIYFCSAECQMKGVAKAS